MSEKQELREISVNDVVVNPHQPRKEFDEKEIEEMGESIVENGLMNPINVRAVGNGKYMIIAGERRWRAHKLKKIKTIKAFVKKYKNEGEWMVESLIENVHRKDLTPAEKGKYLLDIMKEEKIKDYNSLAKFTKIASISVEQWIDNYEFTKSNPEMKDVEHKIIRSTKSFDEEDRKDIIKLAKKNKLTGTTVEEELIPVIRKAPSDVKKALFEDKINFKQAERISKLESADERKKAIQEHTNLARIDKNVEESIKDIKNAKQKREFDKRLIQAGNWVASFRGSVTDSYKSLEKTIKILVVSTKFLPIMDDKQKETLNSQLTRFGQILERAKQLVEQVEEKIDE